MRLPLSAALAALAAACASAREQLPSPVQAANVAAPQAAGGGTPAEATAQDPAVNAVAVPAQVPAPAPASTEAAAPRPEVVDTVASLSVWRDERFQQRFAESLIAETDVEPRVTSVEREAMQEVLDAMAAERTEQAVTLLREQRTPTASAVFDFTLGSILFQQEKLEEAGECYRAAVEKHSRFRRAWRNLGLVEMRLSRFEGAVAAFARLTELGGGDAITYGLLGFAHGNLEQHIAAESAYRMAMLLDPKTLDWRMGLARSFFKQRRFADAAAMTGALVEQFPDRGDLWLLQANALLGMEKPKEAAWNLEMVDRLGQSTVDSLNLLGDIYVNEELYDLAANCYVRALEREPVGKAARGLRSAKALAGRGAAADAERILAVVQARHAAALGADDRKEVLRLRARLAVAKGAGEEEAKLLEEIVALDPLDGDALILLGQHAGRNNQPEKAVFWYERAASLESHEAEAKTRHGQLLVGQGKYAEALPLLRRAQTLKPRENVQKYIEQVERAAQTR